MTGYGRAQAQVDNRDILVEIRSVNSRYLEPNVRLGRSYTYLEEELKNLLKTKVSRGKVEIGVSINLVEGRKADIRVNADIVRGYLEAMQEYNRQCTDDGCEEYRLLPDTLSSGAAENGMLWRTMLQLPDVFRVEKVQDDEDAIRSAVLGVAGQALDAFISMRETEGEKLRADILSRLKLLADNVGIVEKQAPELTEKYRERLMTKLTELLDSTAVDEQRILTEAAIFAEKTAVDEETVRLRSHLSQMEKLLDDEGSIGRKLDFLVQEMNREVNTIGSKVQDVSVTNVVVELKSEIEKIREQIQNIE
jgi:uncharacterized protein (TIGR00255 family)